MSFDDLRKESIRSVETEVAAQAAVAAATPKRMPGSGKFMGLSPVQVFVLSLMLFLNVCALASFTLILFEKITF